MGCLSIETPRLSELCDSDIKKLVATFVHRQFGQSKRISEKDKKSVERFLSEQLQQERVRYQSMMSSSQAPSSRQSSVSCEEEDVFQAAEIQEHLFRIHMKIEPHLNDETEHSVNSVRERVLPDDLSFDTIHKEMEQLSKKLYGLEGEVRRCMEHFKPEVQQTPLSELVGRMHEVLRKQLRELTEEKEHTHRLLNEVDGYSDHIEKLEKERQEYRLQINALHQDMAKLRQDKMALADRCAHLEKVNRQHMEKENTLDNLRSIMKDLRSNATPRQALLEEGIKPSTIRRSVRAAAVRPSGNYPVYQRRYTQGSRPVPKKKSNFTGSNKN